MAQRPKWLVSYRLSVAVVIPLLVAITGGLITVVSYVNSRAGIRKLAGELFAQDAEQTANETRSHLQQAAPAIDVVSAMLAEGDVALSGDALAHELLSVLRANPGFSWVSYSDAAGTFTGVQRVNDGTLLVNHSEITAGKTVMDERVLAADGRWQPHRHLDDTGYDPRTRPFYIKALAAKRRTWTEPYVFFDQGVPGITCAVPVYDRQGTLRGVATVDFDLDSISRFVAALHTSAHARVFVFTDSGAILGHPSAQVVTQHGQGAAGKLATKDDIDDAAVREYFKSDGGAFDFDGDRYLSSTREFEPDVGLAWRVGAIAPESDFMGDLQQTTRVVLAISLVVMLAAIAFAITFARHLARPLVHLAGEMDKVGRFDLSGDAPPSSSYREIERMNRALVAMREGLASFSVYVPRDLVRAVLASGERAVLGGKTKQMTVFFSDLAGFTTLSERMKPAELVELLAGYFDEMTKVIVASRGTIDKFIGDAIMAFWNAPMDEAQHAVLACTAALACQRKLEDIKRADPALAGLSARIGVATGDVLVGNIGSHERMNYTVMGDTVNLASRIEGLGKAYGTRILASEACRRAAGDLIVMRAIDVVAVKGKQEGVRVYEPLATAADADDRAREIAELSERALAAYLDRKWDEAAGIYAELLAYLPGDVASTVLRERCVAYKQAPPPEDWSGAHVMTEK